MFSSEDKFKQIASGKISECRNVVVSEHSGGGYTVAQQLEVEEKGTATKVFMKGAFHIESVDDLVTMRDVINLAIKKIEDGQ